MARPLPPLVGVDTETGKVEWVDEVPDDTSFVIVPRLSVPLLLPDNQVGACYACGQAVQFRPGYRADIPKICIPCVPDFVAGMENSS